MKAQEMHNADEGPDIFISICHLGMILFGIAAWLTGDAADDYKKYEYLWFTVHSWIGMGFALSICLYVCYGTIGPRNARFSRWIPYSKERLLLVREDIAGLMKFRLPDSCLSDNTYRRCSTSFVYRSPCVAQDILF